MKRAIFIGLMVAIPVVFLLIVAAVLVPRVEARLRPLLLQHMANNLTAEERAAIYKEIGLGSSFWDAVPDADVAELGQPNRTLTESGTEVHLNNAGLRSSTPYTPKKPGTFRLVCLGDSFV